MIPENWKVEILGNLMKIVSGAYFEYKEFVNSGIRVLKIDNVMYGKVDWSVQTFLPKEYLSSFKDLVLTEGDIVLALNRPITNNQVKTAQITKRDIPSILYQRVGKIELFSDNYTDRKFLFVLFTSNLFKKIIKKSLIGSDQPYIRTTELLKQKILLPALNEQKKISLIISKIDGLIQKTDQIIEQTQRLKKGLMQRLLTKGIGHTRFRKIALGSSITRLAVPHEWDVVELEGISKIIDTPHYTSPYYPDGVPVIRTADCEQNGQINYSQVKFTTEDEYKKRSTVIDPNINDVLYTREAPPGVAVLVDRKKISVGQRIVLLKLDRDKVIGPYLSVFLNSDLGRKQMESMIIKTTVERINIIHIKALRIILPPLSEQSKLTGIIDTIDTYTSIYKKYYFNFINLKKGLMQNLLTGRIRVKV